MDGSKKACGNIIIISFQSDYIQFRELKSNEVWKVTAQFDKQAEMETKADPTVHSNLNLNQMQFLLNFEGFRLLQ